MNLKIIVLLCLGGVSLSLFANKGYHRSQFGHGWHDVDKDCQDTRAELLIDQSQVPVEYKKKTKPCTVLPSSS